jgi:hypothetical protein
MNTDKVIGSYVTLGNLTEVACGVVRELVGDALSPTIRGESVVGPDSDFLMDLVANTVNTKLAALPRQ